ncbi:hypothetical protein BCR34DRAFT_646687 [Clohesyomyces aquaticus]|uniref:BTB domain-containing protein n=1 Tax=Clohesyomyces aquaticus TaxID=1231657 RepID=A0A1Y1ZWZ3_9PLEO|nr:hypothetical protein BCR34DRAFT_646687 [Clohesyomyces aquaticus]
MSDPMRVKLGGEVAGGSQHQSNQFSAGLFGNSAVTSSMQPATPVSSSINFGARAPSSFPPQATRTGTGFHGFSGFRSTSNNLIPPTTNAATSPSIVLNGQLFGSQNGSNTLIPPATNAATSLSLFPAANFSLCRIAAIRSSRQLPNGSNVSLPQVRHPMASPLTLVASEKVCTPEKSKSTHTFAGGKGHRKLDISMKTSSTEGPVLEIVIGAEDIASRRSWFLPKSLLSSNSVFFEAAIENDSDERQEDSVRLPDVNACTFNLFFEWLYYERYGVPSTDQKTRGASVHAAAWVLGDKLKGMDFKNYAMSRLYFEHDGRVGAGQKFPIMPLDVSLACSNSLSGSSLRRFYFDILAAHFDDLQKVAGLTEEWDKIMAVHTDARASFLHSMTTDKAMRNPVKELEQYMEDPVVSPSK